MLMSRIGWKLVGARDCEASPLHPEAVGGKQLTTYKNRRLGVRGRTGKGHPKGHLRFACRTVAIYDEIRSSTDNNSSGRHPHEAADQRQSGTWRNEVTEIENLSTLKNAYRMWDESKADSVEHWMNLIADDVCWKSLGDGADGLEFSQACNCKHDVERYFSKLAAEWEMLHYTVDEFISQGDRIVVLCRCGWRNKRTGKVVETPKADIIRMRDGKIVEFSEFYDTAKAMEGSR